MEQRYKGKRHNLYRLNKVNSDLYYKQQHLSSLCATTVASDQWWALTQAILWAEHWDPVTYWSFGTIEWPLRWCSVNQIDFPSPLKSALMSQWLTWKYSRMYLITVTPKWKSKTSWKLTLCVFFHNSDLISFIIRKKNVTFLTLW